MSEISRILEAIDDGDVEASSGLLPLVYQELRRLAFSKLAYEQHQSLQATGLVHEAYLRIVDADRPQKWNGRSHFFGAAAEAMRRILVDNARRRNSKKRGGDFKRVDVHDIELCDPGKSDELLALDEALTRLEAEWPEKARLVKLRYFAGLTNAEASEAIGVSTATGERHWRFARAWLHSQLADD